MTEAGQTGYAASRRSSRYGSAVDNNNTTTMMTDTNIASTGSGKLLPGYIARNASIKIGRGVGVGSVRRTSELAGPASNVTTAPAL